MTTDKLVSIQAGYKEM